MMPLEGIRVVEFGGLAPGPFAGMVLSDFGAEVVRIDRPGASNTDQLAMNKKSIVVNIKEPQGAAVLRELIKKADVLIEPFRPGIMEKNGFGPDGEIENSYKLFYAYIDYRNVEIKSRSCVCSDDWIQTRW